MEENNNNHPLKEKEKENEVVIDVETGGTSSEDDVKTHLVSTNRSISRLLSKPCVGLLGFVASDTAQSSALANANKGQSEHSVDILQSQEDLPLLEHEHNQNQNQNQNQGHVSEQHKAINPKKARKPPRPPKGPSLTVSDLKFVREITDLTMKKRARIERIKTLKKMRAAKSSSSQSSSSSSSSSNSTLTAMIITAVFCFVIILQGFSSRTTPTMDFQGSPGPSSESSEGLISVQFYNLSPNARAEQSWESSPRAARQRFLWQGSGPRHRILKTNKWQ